MRFDDTRIDWRIQDVERKAEQAVNRLYEIDEAKRNVDSLEHTVRELSTKIDGLRHELEDCREEIRKIMREEGDGPKIK